MIPFIIGALGMIAYGVSEEINKPKAVKKMANGGRLTASKKYGSISEYLDFAKKGDLVLVARDEKDLEWIGDSHLHKFEKIGNNGEGVFKSFGKKGLFEFPQNSNIIVVNKKYAKGGNVDSFDKIFAEYEDNEDNNYHSENVVLLAKNFGSAEDLKLAQSILKKHKSQGSLSDELNKQRSALSKKLYPKLIASKKVKVNFKNDVTYIPKRDIQSVELKNFKSIPSSDIIDGVYRKNDIKYAKSGKNESYADWESDVLDNIRKTLNVTFGDAQGIMMANEFYMAQSWGKGLGAKETANLILEKSKMAKGGAIQVPYVVWVSKDGDKREFYKQVKSQRAGEMMMNKLWLKDEYKMVGTKSLRSYENDKDFYGKGGNINSEIDALYEKSGFINDDFNWELKLIEMLQDSSIEAYKIYQKLTAKEKESVLQELFEMNNDMGADGDGEIETSRENLEIILEDAKNGKKY